MDKHHILVAPVVIFAFPLFACRPETQHEQGYASGGSAIGALGTER